jgi:signal transduction histidine kinase
MFQTVRELLVNITKHAQARYARVCMKRHENDLCIIIEDNGVGFDTSEISSKTGITKGFGLFAIRERINYIGGHIKIESESGRGTQVTIVAPLKNR